MVENGVKVDYDDENDILFIKLRNFALVDEKGDIIELEIWRAKEIIAKVMADKIAEKIKASMDRSVA